MGLDGVEIVMEAEETFGIAIGNSETEKLRTPRQFIDSIYSKLVPTHDATCLTQRAFYRMRGAMTRQLGIARNQITTETPLTSVFPVAFRKRQFYAVMDEVGITHEFDFVRPAPLTASLIVAVCLGDFMTMLYFLHRYGTASPYVTWPLLSGVAFAVFFGYLTALETRRFKTAFPPHFKTMAAVTRWVVAKNPDSFKNDPAKWNRAQVAEIVRGIVINTLGCEKNYHEDADFVKELGLS